MSDEKEVEQPSLLDTIRIAEGLLGDLKGRCVAAGDNEALAAGFILARGAEVDQLSNALSWLRIRAEEKSTEVWMELSSFLENHGTWPAAAFWGEFHDKLKDVVEADVDFRRKCLFREFVRGGGGTLFHEVCKLNPPAEVVKTLIDMTPPVSERCEDESHIRYHIKYKHGKEFNHLAIHRDQYPLHMVARHGGSFDLVKLLVSAHANSLGDEKEKCVLDTSNSCESVFHVLTANKARHQPNDFALILRHLILSIAIDNLARMSPLIRPSPPSGKRPAGLLWQSLKQEGLSDEDVLRDEDFVFLVKASCYHNLHQNRKFEGSKGYDVRCREIEQIPFARAFLVCSPCFERNVTAKVLADLFSADSGFLLEKDANGEYPIHGILDQDRPSIIHSSVGSCHDSDFNLFLLETILKIAPQCAQQTDEQGLLPLHIAADPQRTPMLDSDRLLLVSAIWKAYPEAANTLDKEFGLPPFALPVRAESNGHERRYCRSDWEGMLYSGVPIAYFLLRQQPEVLSEVITNCFNGGANATAVNGDANVTTEPQAKRPRTSAPSKEATETM